MGAKRSKSLVTINMIKKEYVSVWEKCYVRYNNVGFPVHQNNPNSEDKKPRLKKLFR